MLGVARDHETFTVCSVPLALLPCLLQVRQPDGLVGGELRAHFLSAWCCATVAIKMAQHENIAWIRFGACNRLPFVYQS